VNAIDAKSVSLSNRVTIADEAMAQFRHNVTDPLRAITALREAAKQ